MSSTQRKNDFWQRSQSGQSIVILALGFLALLAFVGIVTDVSLMFVRYSTLRRAVDAASIAAAGQMRRTLDDTSATEADIQADSYANMNLAARNFIELYGLDPDNVIVETCYSQNIELGINPVTSRQDVPLDHNGVPLYNYDGVTGEVDRTNNNGINPLADQDDRLDYEELCTRNELKLVRVTAQVDSPTIFLRLFGFRTITLQESAISQTAVLDVVLMLDVSESMLDETSYASYEAEGYYHRFFPPQLSSSDNTIPEPDLVRFPWWTNTTGRDWDTYLNTPQGTILTTNYGATTDLAAPAYTWVDAANSGATPIRRECQIQFYPSSAYRKYAVSPTVYAEYVAAGLPVGTLDLAPDGLYYSHGFVPAVDYYGCCNDPDGDGSFADLVCQPFRGVRDAAEGFLERLDFVRGDRVAIVTFDRGAHLVDPDGANGDFQDGFIETLADISAPSAGGNRVGALTVLQNQIGVRAEPSFYVDGDENGTWDGFRIAGVQDGAGRLTTRTVEIDGVDTTVNYLSFTDAPAYYNEQMPYNMFESPVRGSCFVDGAYNDPRFSEFDYYGTDDPGPSRYLFGTDGTTPNTDYKDHTLLDEIITPSWLSSMGLAWDDRVTSYEVAAGCRGTNIAGSLEEASTAFYQYGRREGSVWIMVLLSDGAAGATNPVLRRLYPDPDTPSDPNSFEQSVPSAPNLYNGITTITSYAPNDPDIMVFDDPPAYDVIGRGASPDARGTAHGGQYYGAYGLCPYGTAAFPASELTSDPQFPFCSDIEAESRTFCGDTNIQPNLRPINFEPDSSIGAYIDPNTTMNPNGLPCEAIYDVDDFTRDWADFIGLANFTDGGSTNRGIEERLPLIFTIGFGLVPGDGIDDEADTLGEELLRYIADVGDNARLDNDYWQGVMGARIPNDPLADPLNPDYGPRGDCESPAGVPGVWSPLTQTVSCGNYFNASDSAALENVFNQIASRMFTRLAR